MITQLRQWALENEIEKKSINGFWYCFNNYKTDNLEEFIEVFGDDFDKNQLKIQLKNVALFIDEWDAEKIYDSVTYGFDYVVSYIPIEYRNKKLGVYRMLFNLSGESFDDFFMLD
ncbi:hypothetical protein [Paenibacillus alvei]|nr:hypothetical protein [Paenibacillus alvei]MBG9736736.1 hypothetical protein [Paenibacillus alvei]MBG9745871.1 hypothetical protein [Paenibacillus alvei]MCY9583018.1 hypothetical protein [Paenibacillus alvei]MCY9588261.1 hypothetical protein [Paenibacillus alvei]